MPERLSLICLCVLGALGLVTAPAIAGADTATESSRLSVSGSYRLRYEHLDDTFRTVDPGSDELLAARLLLHVRANGERFYGGLELQDSRAWLDQSLTPVGTDDVNVTEPTQAYVGMRMTDSFRPGDSLDIQIGRMAFDVGSRRLVARNRFRNTTNAFTGLNALWTGSKDIRVRAFILLPQARLPDNSDRERLRDNGFDFDEERTEQLFWGVHVSTDHNRLDAEWYLFGLHEDDRPSLPTRNRDLLTAGLRVNGSSGSWAFDWEIAYQFGHSRASTSPTDQADLDHRAWFTHIEASRSFDARFNPRLVLRYDYASGDDDPDDGRFGRFDTLFGARRFEYGPTGIYGAIARSNIAAPGASLQVEFSDELSANLDYRATWLASDSDFLTTAGLRSEEHGPH